MQIIYLGEVGDNVEKIGWDYIINFNRIEGEDNSQNLGLKIVQRNKFMGIIQQYMLIVIF